MYVKQKNKNGTSKRSDRPNKTRSHKILNAIVRPKKCNPEKLALRRVGKPTCCQFNPQKENIFPLAFPFCICDLLPFYPNSPTKIALLCAIWFFRLGWKIPSRSSDSSCPHNPPFQPFAKSLSKATQPPEQPIPPFICIKLGHLFVYFIVEHIFR